MASIPTPRSAQQIIAGMLDSFFSNQNITNIRVGSAVLSIFEAAGQSDFRSSADIFKTLNSVDLSQTTGIALDNKGNSENIPRFLLAPAVGSVTISDSSFTKISTTVAQNQPAPIVGTVTLMVTDASQFPTTGSLNVYIGRGTADYEGPIAYTGITNLGINWSITLATGTTKFHNTSESVIHAQGGNRLVGAGSIVNTPQANLSTAVSYSTLYPTTLPDGETSVANITVVAQQPGQIGNCIAGSITQFASLPFTGAVVTNPSPISTGIDTELDDDYRERIQKVLASRFLGTVLAIEVAATGITDGISRVSSASFVRRFGKSSTLYIDDGSGYEMTTAGVAIESLVDSAIGGEQHFEANQRPIAQAFAETTNIAPFVLRNTDQLAVKVGGITYIHSFNEGVFHSISNASSYEVVASINSDPNIAFSARTIGAGSNVIIFSKSDINDSIEVVSIPDGTDATDANEGLGFTSGVNYTLQLFKNDRLLSKDGTSAIFNSNVFSQWIPLTGLQTLILAVDGTPAVTYDFVDQDFIDANTGFVTLNKNSGDAWAAVFNAKIPGITATFTNGILSITSNVGASSRAQIAIPDGTLLTANFFSPGIVNGTPNDYSLDRNNAQIFLNQALQAGDKLSVGTASTRAFLQSGLIGTTTLGSDAHLWFAIDGQASIVQNGVNSGVPFSVTPTALHPWGHNLTLNASAGTPFSNVLSGDWVILWDSNLDASLQGVFKVVTATSTTIVIERREGTGIRAGHRSVALQTSGATTCSVLTCGGTANTQTTLGTSTSLITNSAEIYNPNTKLSTPIKAMATPRAYHTATTLQNGKVLVTGGVTEGGDAVTTLEIYDPTGDAWTLSGVTLTDGVYHHQATLLTSGSVLITGGQLTGGVSTTSTFYVYDPGSDTFTTTGALNFPRCRHKAVLMPNSDVFIAGGKAISALNSTEIWSHTGLVSTTTAPMTRARYDFGLALIGTSPTTIMAAGNSFGLTGNDSYEIYTIGSDTWGTETTIPGNVVYENKDLTTIPNGHVVGLYGYDSGTVTNSIGFTYNGSFTTIVGDTLWTDSSAKFDTQQIAIANGSATVENEIAVIGGAYQNSTFFGFAPTANIEEYDEVGDLWTIPDPATNASVNLASVGISFGRTSENIQQITVPAGTNYTASSLTTALNSSLIGAEASVYLTNQIRINTNSYGTEGDIALLGQDTAAVGLQLQNTDFIPNLVNHVGSTESGSDLGTPSFQDNRIMASIESDGLSITHALVAPDQGLVGLKNWMGGIDNTTTLHPTAYTYLRSGDNYNFYSRLSSAINFTSSGDVFLRSTPDVPFVPSDRVYFAAPFAIGPNDILNVLVDNDITKQFAVNMFRQLNTTNNTYGQSNAFRDESGGNVSLAVTFGLDFNFNDFTAYMPSRALAFTSDANREMLFRYYRPGADGNIARVRFGNPIGPNQPVASNVSINNGAAFTGPMTIDVTVQLASGALRTPTTHNSTRLGQVITSLSGTGSVLQILNLAAASASRTSNVTTLTLTLPGSVTDHGLAIGNLIWVNSTDVNFSSGFKAITSRPTGTTITYAETATNNTGTNIGDVSFDSLGEATFAGSGTVVGDWFRFVDPLNSVLGNLTFHITAVDGSGRSVTTQLGDQIDPTTLTTGTTILWYPISVASNLETFVNTPQTAGTVVTSINALAGLGNPTLPVTATLLSTGTGTITESTADLLNDYTSWYVLSDGVNWIQSTTPPGTIAGDYTLTFKNPVNGTISVGADWSSEIIYLCPSTAQNVVDWLNAPTVSGLSTACSVQTSNRGQNVQIATLAAGSTGGIQVQGGLANGATGAVVGTSVNFGVTGSYSTVINSDALGLTAGDWCEIDNTIPQPIFLFTTGMRITSWAADGLIQFNSPIAARAVGQTQAKMQFEKQGKFIAISDMGMNGSIGVNLVSVSEGDWLRISVPTSPTISEVASGNQGIFRILRIDRDVGGSNGTIFIENTNGIEEQSECVIEVLFELISAMPGDSFVVLDPVFGVNNQGVWTILDVGTTTATSGDSFTNLTSFVVDVSTRSPQVQGVTPLLTSSNKNLVYVVQGTPSNYIRKIIGISPNQTNGAYTDITWDTYTPQGCPDISAASGSIISALDKLNFSLNYFSGVDGYNYATGLVGKVNTVMYGDPEDSITFPGVAAADAHIDVSGSVVKRVQIALAVRVKTGTILTDMESRIKSAVATVINQNPTGRSIAFGAIIAVVQAIVGEVSVVITSPIYNITNDLIPVQPQEKTKVLNLDDDIQVSFLGV